VPNDAAAVQAAADADLSEPEQVENEVARSSASARTTTRRAAARPVTFTAESRTFQLDPEELSAKLEAIEEPSVLRAVEAAAAVDATLPSASPTSPDRPQPRAAGAANLHRSDLQPSLVAAIETLSVEGALTPKVVQRGVLRLVPYYQRCTTFCDSAPQQLSLSTTIDEAGHSRLLMLDGSSRPDLRRCVERATARLSVPAPDTGTARARWTVRFNFGRSR
jgi:hypothetical protein